MRSQALPRCAVIFAVLVSQGMAAPAARRAVATQAEAVRIIRQAAAAPRPGGEFSRLVTHAAELLDSLASEIPPAPELERELRAMAVDLRGSAAATPSPFSPDPSLRLLERVAARLRATDLPFQGSYSQPKVEEPAYGGHASAMGPPPSAPSKAPARPSPVQFEAVPGLLEKTYCGGRTKDSLLESGGSGVALFDYDGDGLLD